MLHWCFDEFGVVTSVQLDTFGMIRKDNCWPGLLVQHQRLNSQMHFWKGQKNTHTTQRSGHRKCIVMAMVLKWDVQQFHKDVMEILLFIMYYIVYYIVPISCFESLHSSIKSKEYHNDQIKSFLTNLLQTNFTHMNGKLRCPWTSALKYNGRGCFFAQ